MTRTSRDAGGSITDAVFADADTFSGRRDNSADILGVAIAVPDPLADRLTEWRERVGDPQALLVPPHVTLLPPTEIAGLAPVAVREHLEAVATSHAPFRIHLAGTGSFRPVSQVVFVTVADGISPCELLAADIRTGLLSQSLEFPYHPHVTIAHDVEEDMLDLAYEGLVDVDVQIPVESFFSYEQQPSGRWVPVQEYRLTGNHV